MRNMVIKKTKYMITSKNIIRIYEAPLERFKRSQYLGIDINEECSSDQNRKGPDRL